MATHLSKKLSTKHGSVSVQATFNKKSQMATVLVSFDTKSALLFPLLQKYAYDKCSTVYRNINNQIHSVVVGENSIALTVPEPKILNNVMLVYKYILRAKVPANILKQLPATSHSYNALAKDVQSFSVTVLGRCKRFIKMLQDGAPKVEAFTKNLSTIEKDDRDNVEGQGKKLECCPSAVKLDGLSQDGLLYLAIVSGHIPSKITKTSITFLDIAGSCQFAELLEHKGSFQERVKAFLTQAGSLGSPSKNDKDKSKFKEKKAGIEAVLQAAVDMLETLHGVKLTAPSDVTVNHDVMSEIKKIKI
jgi:hypothetical protein